MTTLNDTPNHTLANHTLANHTVTNHTVTNHTLAHTSAPAAGHHDDTLDPRVHERRWLILGVLCLSLFIIVMDNTILNVAIPSLITDLGASNSEIQWIIDSYVIVFAGLLLTSGSLSDRFGRKGALQAGIVLFGIGSVSRRPCRTRPTQLIFTRAFMGIGGALIMPATLSILTNVFRDPHERGRAIAIWAGVSRGSPSPSARSPAACCSSTSRGARCSGSTSRSASRRSSSAPSSFRSRATPSRPGSTRSARSCRSSGWRRCCSASSRDPTRAGRATSSSASFVIAAIALIGFVRWEHTVDPPDARHERVPQPAVLVGE